MKEIKLRKLVAEDAIVLAELGNNKKIWDNLRDRMPHPYTIQDAKSFIESNQNEETNLSFGITSNNELCGIIGLMPQTDVYKKSAELGYWIGEPYWGQGVASQAVKQIINYGFDDLGLERIYAGAYSYNIGSMRVLEKNGFQAEGVFRKSAFKNGKLYNEHRYGKLKTDK